MADQELSDEAIWRAQRHQGRVNVGVGALFLVMGTVLLVFEPRWATGAIAVGATFAIIGCARLLGVRKLQRASDQTQHDSDEPT